jgi:integrase/recombinase XerD
MTKPRRMQAVIGPLATNALGFRVELEARGYSSSAVNLRLWLLGSISRWLDQQGLSANDLTTECVEQFVQDRRVRGYKSWVSMRSPDLVVGYLRSVGAAPAPNLAVTEGPVDVWVASYGRYLVDERGLTDSTTRHYQYIARLFLSAQEARGGVEPGRLSAADVVGFVGRECTRLSTSAAKYSVAALRSLLRYLHVAGVTSIPLALAVPGVANWRDSSLPRGLDAAQVGSLLASCDRRRGVGRRDYAILKLLVRLGLRVAEVAGLELDDVNWHQGELLIRGKGDRHERLPLPHDVGEALVAYLKFRGQGPDGCRRVFLRVLAPLGGLARTAVEGVVHDACVRAGLPVVGAHHLRHTAATEMLRAGASLPDVAQVLRHRRIETTSIYAKVDRRALRALAQPWPGGAA